MNPCGTVWKSKRGRSRLDWCCPSGTSGTSGTSDKQRSDGKKNYQMVAGGLIPDSISAVKNTLPLSIPTEQEKTEICARVQGKEGREMGWDEVLHWVLVRCNRKAFTRAFLVRRHLSDRSSMGCSGTRKQLSATAKPIDGN